MTVVMSCKKTFCFSVMSPGSLGLHMSVRFGLKNDNFEQKITESLFHG